MEITHENTLFFLTGGQKKLVKEYEVYNNPG